MIVEYSQRILQKKKAQYLYTAANCKLLNYNNKHKNIKTHFIQP